LLVAALSFLTLGLFALVWSFVQSRWVRRIEPKCKAQLWFAVAAVCWIIVCAARVLHWWAPGILDVAQSVPWLALGFGVCWLIGTFSMAFAMRRHFTDKAIYPHIDVVMLFIFTIYYLQAHLSRIARWQKSGQAPAPVARAPFWWLLIVVLLAAMAVAAAWTVYANYPSDHRAPLTGQVSQQVAAPMAHSHTG
ncbi:MAG: hypothetical protein L0H70_10240, partial [Xanthomonadales bacterium]|nr:hypothetical protein [Xanthomonadales bacterium]